MMRWVDWWVMGGCLFSVFLCVLVWFGLGCLIVHAVFG